MLLLNIVAGFDIIGTLVNHRGEGRIILELSGAEKEQASVESILEEFAALRGEGEGLSDRTLLA